MSSARGGNGEFIRTIDGAERDAEAARLRARGLTYEQIANQLGYPHRSNARTAVESVLKATIEEPAAEVRKFELERLDTMWQAALKVLETDHLAISNGRIVRRFVDFERDADGIERLGLDGKPIPIYEDVKDDGPVLSAIDRLLAIQQRRAKLLGLDVAVKVEATVHQVDPSDLALAELLREAKAKQAAEEARLKGDGDA